MMSMISHHQLQDPLSQWLSSFLSMKHTRGCRLRIIDIIDVIYFNDALGRSPQ